MRWTVDSPHLGTIAFLLSAGVLIAGSCERRGDSTSGVTETAGAEAQKATAAEADEGLPESVDGAKTPRTGGKWSPSLVRHAGQDGEAVDPEVLSEVESCGECHAETVAEWQDSMHAFASFNNPLYRVAFDQFVENRDAETGRFCAGCHDPAPLFDGSIDSGIEPEQDAAHAGVTCNTCHGIQEATADGNASYTVRTDPVPVPDAATAAEADPEKLKAHVERTSMTALRTDALCISCHRGFLSPATGHDVFILGFDEYAPWRRSGYADNPATRVDHPVTEQSCVDCHMPEGPDGRHSHRFAGGHSAFAAMLDSEPQLEAVKAMLAEVATIDIAAVGQGKERFPTSPETFSLRQEEKNGFWLDVVVRNLGVGHNFPGGQRDLRDTWIEVVVEDADGDIIAEAGREHRESGDDPSAHRLRALLLTPEAETEKTHSVAHFRTKAYDHTVPTRDAELARYRWKLPEESADPSFPLTVRARLLHRRLSKSFHEMVCETSGTERGEAFIEATEQKLGVRPDPCAEQPIIEMAADSATLREEGYRLSDAKTPWRRWYERGLAMQNHLSERLDEALDSFRRAEKALEGAGDAELSKKQRKQWRAMVLDGKARVMARQRRNEDAVAAFDAAEEAIGAHPAISVGRGDAYANVWRFKEAVEDYRKAARLVDDDRVWRKLAIGLGSLGQHRESLLAARKGLAIEPRDPDLLRSQMIALRKLEAPEAWVTEAAEAFERYKRDEEAHLLQAECSDRSEICRKERLPIHTHELQSLDASR